MLYIQFCMISGMSRGPVKPENYRTCVCGKVCKGRSALANHAAKCDRVAVRRQFDLWCWNSGLKFVSDAFFNANFDSIVIKMESSGA